MNFKKIELKTRVKMSNLPVLWGPPDWPYGKERQAENEARIAGCVSEHCLVGELTGEPKDEWADFPQGALVVNSGPVERDFLDTFFWVSTEPFVYVETSTYKCPSCKSNVFYTAVKGWYCENFDKTYGRKLEPDFIAKTGNRPSLWSRLKNDAEKLLRLSLRE